MAVQTETWGQALSLAQSWLNAEVRRNDLISTLEAQKNTSFNMQPELFKAV